MLKKSGMRHRFLLKYFKIKKGEVMKRSFVFAISAATALLFIGCGGDKKVEERVAQIQTSAPVGMEANSTATPVAEASKAAMAASTSIDGKQIFATRCAACHGEKGEGKGSYPKLAGNTKEEALKKLKGYVDGTYGKEQKMIMVGQAKGIDDAQKVAVSEYIATLK